VDFRLQYTQRALDDFAKIFRYVAVDNVSSEQGPGKPEKQIPRRLKPARDDKNKRLPTAHLKMRAFADIPPPPTYHDVSRMNNLGILLSGRGSNFEAIADHVASGKLDANIAVVISNRADAGGIESARRRGLKALVIPSKGKPREQHDREVVAALLEQQVDLVCLAGYMRLLSPWFVQQFPNRILNIHPALLPAFPGLEAQKQAFDYGVKVSGCTVHFVDADLDHGAILVQKVVPVLDSDDNHTLAARILEQEHVAYTEAIRMVLEGKYRIEGRRVVMKSQQR
jgi:phosphoribosylglycinamide formyltransferase-1